MVGEWIYHVFVSDEPFPALDTLWIAQIEDGSCALVKTNSAQKAEQMAAESAAGSAVISTQEYDGPFLPKKGTALAWLGRREPI